LYLSLSLLIPTPLMLPTPSSLLLSPLPPSLKLTTPLLSRPDIKCLTEYWLTKYNWRKQEEELNNLPHYMTRSPSTVSDTSTSIPASDNPTPRRLYRYYSCMAGPDLSLKEVGFCLCRKGEKESLRSTLWLRVCRIIASVGKALNNRLLLLRFPRRSASLDLRKAHLLVRRLSLDPRRDPNLGLTLPLQYR
jgi:hypothetical protein